MHQRGIWGSSAEQSLLNKTVGMVGMDVLRAIPEFRNEPLFIEKYGEQELNSEDCIRLLAVHPELMQRPIAVNGEKAIISRPPEKIRDIL